MKLADFDAAGFPRGFFDPDINSVIPDGAVQISDDDWREFLTASGLRRWDGSKVVVVQAPPVVMPPARTFKADIWRRCSDAQAEILASLLAQQTVRQQRMFNDATELSHGDPEFNGLYGAVTQTLGSAEAARILAPSV